MCPLRGGNFDNSGISGLSALNGNNTRTNANTNNGGRLDSDSPQTAMADSGAKGGAFLHLAQAFAKSAGRPFSSRHPVVLERLGAILS